MNATFLEGLATQDTNLLIQNYITRIAAWAVGSGLRILLVIILAWILSSVLRVILTRLFTRLEQQRDGEYKKRIATLHSIVSVTVGAILFTVAAFLVLGELGMNLGPVLAAAGVVGLAVGFGAQTLVQDVITGFFMLVEDQIRVGDVVEVEGHGGLVERLTLRLTILRDLAGNVHFVRNGQINTVINMTKDYSRFVYDIGVSYDADLDEVIRVVREVDEGMRAESAWKGVILEPIEVLGLDKFDASAVIVKARSKTLPIRQWDVAREFNRRLKHRFDERGIAIPYPQLTLHMDPHTPLALARIRADRERPPRPPAQADTEEGAQPDSPQTSGSGLDNNQSGRS